MGCGLPIIILPMHREDILEVSVIHSEQFLRQTNSRIWVQSNFAAYPRIMIFVARNERDKVVGYIQWLHKSGFRKEAVMELEQIAVLNNHQGQGIATQLIQESLQAVKDALKDSGCRLKTIMVSTRSDNQALNLYKKTLGVEEVCTITGLYSADEILMIKTML